jgi:DNA-directed RNA polymerase subunit F
MQEVSMAESTGKWDEVENELFEIAAELTALGDMIPGLFLNIEEMEPETPKGIKILIADTRKRIEDLRKYIGGFRRVEGVSL